MIIITHTFRKLILQRETTQREKVEFLAKAFSTVINQVSPVTKGY